MCSSEYLIDGEHGRGNNRGIIKTRIPLALAAFVSAGLAFADTLSSYPDSLPKVSCDEFHYGDAFLHRYPMAPAACQEVKVADGERWAKFAAKVYLVELPDFVAFEIPDLEGFTTTINIEPRPTDDPPSREPIEPLWLVVFGSLIVGGIVAVQRRFSSRSG